jgi:hypothetical protein
MGAFETLIADLELDRLAAIILAQAFAEGGFALVAEAPIALAVRALRYFETVRDEREAAKLDPSPK